MDHRNWTENSSRTRVPIDGADIRTRRQWGIRTENAGKMGTFRDFKGIFWEKVRPRPMDRKERIQMARRGKENLEQQMRSAVFGAFREGMDKRSAKMQGADQMEKKIYSYASRNQLLDRIHDFVGTMKDDLRQEGIRKREELRPEHVEKYLEIKATTCSQNTINEYASELKKIGRLIGIDLQVEPVIAIRKKSDSRGAESVMSREDLGKILEYAREHPDSGSSVAIRLEALIGVRVGDLAYGIRIDQGKLRIKSKNGKWCERMITPEIRKILESESCRKLIDGDRIRFPKDGSINKYLLRTERKLGLEEHSFHDIRRRIAQDKYDEFRTSGMSRSDSLRAVSAWLNHGPDRQKMLLESYIADPW